MAVAAVLRDDQPDRVELRPVDVVSRVAVRADRGRRAAGPDDEPAVDRIHVLHALRAVAFSAYVGNVQVPVRACLAARRIHVMRVVAVVARRIRARLVLPVGPRMDGFHVMLDLVHHHAQPRKFLGLSFLLRGRPQVLVAGYAAHLQHALLVRDGNVLVAFHAQPFAVNALLETVLDHMQRTRSPVRSRRRESLVSVTGQADFVGIFFSGLSVTGRRRAAKADDSGGKEHIPRGAAAGSKEELRKARQEFIVHIRPALSWNCRASASHNTRAAAVKPAWRRRASRDPVTTMSAA